MYGYSLWDLVESKGEENHHEIGNNTLKYYVQELRAILSDYRAKRYRCTATIEGKNPLHLARDQVLIKRWKTAAFQPGWEGPRLVLAVTETAVKKPWSTAEPTIPE